MNKILLGVTSLIVLFACGGQAEPAADAAVYRQEILDWRQERLAALKAPTGYLNQTGLFWLEPGSHTFGTGAGNDIRFPGDGADAIGVFEVDERGVSMTVAAATGVTVGGAPVEHVLIASDRAEVPVMVHHRSLAWSVVERDGRFAVRLRDFEHPFVAEFGPLPYFDIDSDARVPAILERYEEPRIANVGTVIEGLGYHPTSPGTVQFEIGGARYELEAYQSGERLFFVFGDATNRDDTYGAGRFLYAADPGTDGRTILDFNKAYSPPCAFNDFSTCPVASPRNRLPIRIEAGEKYEPTLHFSPDVAR